MLSASIGGRDAALRVYRHALVRLMIPVLGPLRAGPGWSALSLALCWICMSWHAGPTLAQRFESALAVLDTALPRRRRPPRTYQGLVKALSRRGGAVQETLSDHLRTLTRGAAKGAWVVGRFVPIGVDGSKFDAPRTAGNDPLGHSGKDKCAPQMMTLLLVHLGSMLPWGFKIGQARDSERGLLRSCLDLLPQNTLLVADAGFTGFDFISELRGRGVHVLIRVGRGARLLQELGYARESKSTVYLWPDLKQDRPPLVLRLVRVGEMSLVTSVTDRRELTKKTVAELYRRRWGLEVAFRSLKQTLERRKVRSGTAGHAKAELAWAILGLWALALIGARAIGGDLKRLSVAKVLSALRGSIVRPGATRRLASRLRRAVRDTYRRVRPKAAWDWPHKKNPPAPGEPKLIKATRSQVSAAQRLRSKTKAA